MEWNELTKRQQKIVGAHHKECIKDKSMNCYKYCKTVEEFWNNHQEMDYPEYLIFK